MLPHWGFLAAAHRVEGVMNAVADRKGIRTQSVAGAMSVLGGLLTYRIGDLAPNPAALVVV
jgi:hypothetical protein